MKKLILSALLLTSNIVAYSQAFPVPTQGLKTSPPVWGIANYYGSGAFTAVIPHAALNITASTLNTQDSIEFSFLRGVYKFPAIINYKPAFDTTKSLFFGLDTTTKRGFSFKLQDLYPILDARYEDGTFMETDPYFNSAIGNYWNKTQSDNRYVRLQTDTFPTGELMTVYRADSSIAIIMDSIESTNSDLNNKINEKLDIADYSPQVKADWNETNPIDISFIDNKPTLSLVATSNQYNDLTGIPSTFTPSSHTHSVSQVTGLQDSLNEKYDSNFVYTKGAVNILLMSKANSTHGHGIGDIVTLSSALLGKLAVGDTLHLSNRIDSVSTALNGKVSTTSIITNSATLNFPSTNANEHSDLTISLSGAVVGDVVLVGVPNISIVNNSCFTAWVSATNTVTVRFNNYNSIATGDPASGTFKVTIIK